MFGKAGKQKIDWPVIFLGVIVVYLLFPGPVGNLTNSIAETLGLEVAEAPAPAPAPIETPAEGCVDPTVKVTMTLDAEDAYAPATTPGGDNRVWINGEDQGLVAQGNSITVSPGDTYVILWVENSSTYYGKVSKGTVPCSGTLRLKEHLYQWTVSKASGTLFNVYNEQGQVGSAPETASGTYFNITLDAGDLETVNFEVKGVYKEALGNPELSGENVVACLYNKTAFDDIIMEFDGFSNSEVSCPNLVTPTAGFLWACFSAPSLVSNEKVTGTLLIDADDTYAPSADEEDITCFMWDADYDIHSITNEVIHGVEDDLDTDLGHTGQDDWNFTFHVT